MWLHLFRRVLMHVCVWAGYGCEVVYDRLARADHNDREARC